MEENSEQAKTHVSDTSSHDDKESQESEQDEQVEEPKVRVSQRSTKGKKPKRLRTTASSDGAVRKYHKKSMKDNANEKRTRAGTQTWILPNKSNILHLIWYELICP